VGLGGNLGSVTATFVVAIGALRARFGAIRVSRLYRTRALGPKQPDFLNAALELRSPGALSDLLVVLQSLEAEAGRVRAERWGPRTLDLDILWAGYRLVQTSSLTVPHEHLRDRAFALVPLLDLAPQARDPVSGQPYADLVSEEARLSIAVVDAGLWWEKPMSL
jgi:2-amino-4-hydroxy-6-hydroxymethyldihydropteridine diphosphokinase